MKKKFLSVVFLSLLVVLLVSCKGSADVELKTMSMFGGTDPHVETYEGLIADFEAENDITINDSSATSDEIWKTSVIASFYSGNDPDVLFYFTGAIAKPLIDNRKVVSIAEIREEYPNFAKNISDCFTHLSC